MPPTDRAWLKALRAQATALVAQLDARLAETAEPAYETTDAGGCRHERRIPAGRMGAPDAWICKDCDFDSAVDSAGER